MKRQNDSRQSGRRLILSALAVLTLTIVMLPVGAQAKTRIKVRVKTPIVQAVFHSGNHGSGLRIGIPVGHRVVLVTDHDRRIARRLARRTEYHRSELLQLRRVGYTWSEIGRLLRVPRRTMSVVLNPVKCGNDSRRGGNLEIGYYDDDHGRRSRHGKRR